MNPYLVWMALVAVGVAVALVALAFLIVLADTILLATAAVLASFDRRHLRTDGSRTEDSEVRR